LSIVDRKDRPDFAITKIAQFYSAIPRLFPRLKAVNWLSVDTIEHAMPGRQLNDFSLLDDSSIAAKYAELVAPEYFLESLDSDSAPVEYVPLRSGIEVSGKLRLSAVVKTYDSTPSVVWNVNGDPSSPKTEPGAYEAFVDTARLRASSATIAVIVRDRQGRIAGKKEVKVGIGS
jgi:hypothetical protein